MGCQAPEYRHTSEIEQGHFQTIGKVSIAVKQVVIFLLVEGLAFSL